MSDTATITITLPVTAHTFRFSAVFTNRLYFYANDWNADVRTLPPGKWEIIETEKKDGRLFMTLARYGTKKKSSLNQHI